MKKQYPHINLCYFLEQRERKIAFMFCTIIAVYSTFFYAAAYAEEPYQGELFLVSLPDGKWKQLSNESRMVDGVLHVYPQNQVAYIQEHETIDEWTLMVTREMHKSVGGVDPEWYLLKKKNEGTSHLCPGQLTHKVFSGNENNYPTAVTLEVCPKYLATGKGEITMYKAVGGKDSLYTVWLSHRTDPFDVNSPPVSNEVLDSWLKYLRSRVIVCDLRIRGSCPEEVERHPERY